MRSPAHIVRTWVAQRAGDPTDPIDAATEPAVRRRFQMRPFLHLIWVLVKDSVWRFKVSSIVILVSENVGLTLQAGALVLMLRYAGWLEQDETITYFGRTWEARTSLELLWLFAGAVAVLLAVAGGLSYLSKTRALNLRGRYELFCSKRALQLFSEVPRVAPSSGQPVANDSTIMRVARYDARYAGRILFLLVNSIAPAITFVAVFIALLFLELDLTLILIVVMALSGLIFYRVNVMGARASRQVEELAGEASKEYKRAIRWLRAAAFPRPDDPDWLATSVTDSKPTKRYLKAYELRLRATEDARLVANVVAAVSFFAILATFGTQIIRSGEGFGAMIVYLVALRRGMTSFRDVNRRLSGVSRFYPQIKRYITFVEASEALLGERGPVERPSSLRLEVRGPSVIEGSTGSWDVQSPSRIGFLSPIAVDRYSLAMLVDCLFGGADTPSARYVVASSAFATPDYEPLARQPFRISVGVPRDWDRERFLEELGGLGFSQRDLESIPDLDVPCDEGRWRRVGDDVRFVLAVLSAGRSSAQWIFLDERGLWVLSEEQRAALLGRLGGHVVVIAYYHRRSDPGAYGEDVVAVVDGEELIGLGPVEWFTEVRPHAEAALIDGPLGHISRLGRLVDDEEDEDEVEDEELI